MKAYLTAFVTSAGYCTKGLEPSKADIGPDEADPQMRVIGFGKRTRAACSFAVARMASDEETIKGLSLMAVFLQGGYDPTYWNTYKLELCDPEDEARIQAGKDWLKKKARASLEETRDGYRIKFRSTPHPWRAEFLPQTLQFEKGTKLPSLVADFPGCNTEYSRAVLVSSDLKDLIETHRNEVDGWNFFPVEILNKDGTHYDTYFVWWVHAVCDAIDAASTGMKSVAGPVNGLHDWTAAPGEQNPDTLRVHADSVGGRSAWIDFRYQPWAGVFVSNCLFDDMVAKGFNGFEAKSFWADV